MIEEDFDDVIRCYSFPIGSYMIANDDRLNVRTFFREFRLTVRQLVTRFGMDQFGEIDWTKFKEEEDNTTGSQELACTGGVCEVVAIGDV